MVLDFLFLRIDGKVYCFNTSSYCWYIMVFYEPCVRGKARNITMKLSAPIAKFTKHFCFLGLRRCIKQVK